MSVVTIDEFRRFGITKLVAVVKQGVKAVQRKRVTETGLNL